MKKITEKIEINSYKDYLIVKLAADIKKICQKYSGKPGVNHEK